MKTKINRREFIKQGAAFGASAVAGAFALPSLLSKHWTPENIDITVVQGDDCFASTHKAVEMLGGMTKFVRPGSRVSLLANSVWDRPGTYTNPDIVIAVVSMCLAAGAKEIRSIENRPGDYWERGSLHRKFEKELKNLASGGRKIELRLETWKSLRRAEVAQSLIECDVFINIPIVKDHAGTHATGVLKNMMGACPSSTNRFFHTGSGASGAYEDVEFLSQCIADLNLVRQPDLCVADATQFITTNGPAGPGRLKKLNKVVAGKNCVSVDAYCATLLDLKPEEVLMIPYAHQHGLGEMDLKQLAIREVRI